jgi:hypothetical protein
VNSEVGEGGEQRNVSNFRLLSQNSNACKELNGEIIR